jgi:hypothetical protein
MPRALGRQRPVSHLEADGDEHHVAEPEEASEGGGWHRGDQRTKRAIDSGGGADVRESW